MKRLSLIRKNCLLYLVTIISSSNSYNSQLLVSQIIYALISEIPIILAFNVHSSEKLYDIWRDIGYCISN